MKQDTLRKKVQENLKEGEKFLDFLAGEIQKSSQVKVGLWTVFSPVLKEEQRRYTAFQNKFATWTKENFVLRRELSFATDDSIEQRRQFLALLEDEATILEGLFDSWEDTVEAHKTAQTDALKVTIPLVALLISLFSFIIALLK